MLERNSGSILFVQSPAGYSAWGSATTYISARYALRGLFSAIEADLYYTNIKVHEMTLGLTTSNYFINNKDSMNSIPVFGKILGSITVQQAANSILNAIECGKGGVHVYPFSLNLAFLFKDTLLVKYLTVATGKRLIPK